MKDEKIPVRKELRREVMSYYGIEYALILMTDGHVGDITGGVVDEHVWWNIEYTEGSRRLARAAGKNFLWADTHFMKDARLQEKRQHCELLAVSQINDLLSKHAWNRTKWIVREIGYYFYVIVATTPARIVWRIRKIIGTQA